MAQVGRKYSVKTNVKETAGLYMDVEWIRLAVDSQVTLF